MTLGLFSSSRLLQVVRPPVWGGMGWLIYWGIWWKVGPQSLVELLQDPSKPPLPCLLLPPQERGCPEPPWRAFEGVKEPHLEEGREAWGGA